MAEGGTSIRAAFGGLAWLGLISLGAMGLASCAGGLPGLNDGAPAAAPAGLVRTSADILRESPAEAWRDLDLENTLVMDLGPGREVVIELAPAMAPLAAANIKTLARSRYFDGLTINRVQDNFVTQWGDSAEDEARKRPIGPAAPTLAPEFDRAVDSGPAFIRLPDPDGFAQEVGFVGGFPAARNPREGRMWLTHCYAMVGVGRDNAPESGNGVELYAVIGHSPRQLDRNITLAGRVVWGIEHLAALPRGTGPLGFYERAEQRLLIRTVRVAADQPNGGFAGQLEALRTDSATFSAVIEARRNRRDAWYLRPAGHIDLCNVPLPVRRRAS
jgi:peptidylprolyl isomerase